VQLFLDREELSFIAYPKDFKRDIEILMADQDVQFKVKTLNIWELKRNQFHILDWLLLKSPNLIDLKFLSFTNDIEGLRLEN
jgi:hypothetical protein